MPAVLLFTGGPVFTGTGSPLHGHAVAVTRGPHQRDRARRRGGRAHPGRRTASAPGSRTRTSTRSARASSSFSATSPRPRMRPTRWPASAPTRRRQPRRAVSARRRLVDGPLPGWRPDPRGRHRRQLLLLSRDHSSTWANKHRRDPARRHARYVHARSGRQEHRARGRHRRGGAPSTGEGRPVADGVRLDSPCYKFFFLARSA